MPYNTELGFKRYVPAEDRYEQHPYRRVGRSGLQLPPVSLGLWQNFGDDRPLANSRAIVRRAFDLGITHFDLANNYGPPYGSAEINFGRIFEEDLKAYRDELIISTKAGYDMWPGPYGELGGRASTCWPASSRASSGCGLTTSTSSTRTASIPTRRWRRRWARCMRRFGAGRRATRESPHTDRAGPRRRPRSCG